MEVQSSRRSLRWGGALFIGLHVLLGTGCGSMTRHLVREATPAAVDSGIREATSDENQDAIVDSIEPQRVEEATDKIVSGTTDGLAMALSEPERQERLGEALAPLVGTLVDSAMDRGFSEEHMVRVRELAKQATLGFQDAIDEVERLKQRGAIPEDEGNVLAATDDLAEHGDWALYGLIAVAGVLFLLLVGAVIWAMRRKKQYERENARRDEALAEITHILSREGLAQSSGDGAGADIKDPDQLRESVRRWADERHNDARPNGH